MCMEAYLNIQNYVCSEYLLNITLTAACQSWPGALDPRGGYTSTPGGRGRWGGWRNHQPTLPPSQTPWQEAEPVHHWSAPSTKNISTDHNRQRLLLYMPFNLLSYELQISFYQPFLLYLFAHCCCLLLPTLFYSLFISLSLSLSLS